MAGAVTRHTVIERYGRVAPLGVRFRDALTASFVFEGLVCEAWNLAEPRRRARGFPNASGTFVWLDLPGVRERTFGRGDDDYWAAQIPALPFVVEVSDLYDRFLPFRFTVAAPARGLTALTCDTAGSPPGSAFVPVYSAPSRVPPGATVVIRAELFDPVANVPAAWAVVEAFILGRSIGKAISDGRGQLLLLAPYPEPQPLPLTGGSASPPATPRQLWDQRWPVKFEVRYDRLEVSGDELPDLCAVLQQRPAFAWRDAAMSVRLDATQLHYGRELRLESADLGRRLLVTAAGSP